MLFRLLDLFHHLNALRIGTPRRNLTFLLREEWHFRRLGIRQANIVSLRQLGLDAPLREDHWPSYYCDFTEIMADIPIRKGRDVFLDYGSGMGVVLRMAAEYPFRRIVGVEISSHLTGIARDLLDRENPRMKCKEYELVVVDAQEYRLPEEVTVAYLYNPFGGTVLRRVMMNIRDSLLSFPRPFTLIYKNAVHAQVLTPLADMLRAKRLYRGVTGHMSVVMTAPEITKGK